MITTIYKTSALASGFGLATLAQLDPIATGDKLGSLGPSAILGVVCVACVIGMVRVYRDRESDAVESRKAHDEHTKKLYGLIEASTAAMQAQAIESHTATKILVEVKDAVRGRN